MTVAGGSNAPDATRGLYLAEVEDLLLAEIKSANSERDTYRLLLSDADARIQATKTLLSSILDVKADFEYNGAQLIKACDAARNRIAPADDSIQPTVASLLALICLNVKLLEKRFESPNSDEQARADCYCRKLFEDTDVSTAIREVYGRCHDKTTNRVPTPSKSTSGAGWISPA